MDNSEDQQNRLDSLSGGHQHVCYLQNEKHAQAFKRTLQPLHELAESMLGQVVLGVLEWHEPSLCLVFPNNAVVYQSIIDKLQLQFVEQVQGE